MNIKLNFGKKGYIASPYWPEMYQCIEIEKKSGVNRARTDANRRKALEAYLSSENMTPQQYEALKALAARPFHADEQGIYIPADNIISALVNANMVAPRSMRIENLRVAVTASDFRTDKQQPDGIWRRFAVVTMGTGQKASNQRGLRENAYIQDFAATGTIDVEPEMVDPKALVKLLEFTGRIVGIGASRKMGWGRFTVEQ